MPIITRTVTSTAGGTQTVTLTPGDPGYFSGGQGQQLGSSPFSGSTIIGYGAYVDLGYPLYTGDNSTNMPISPTGTSPTNRLTIPRPQFNGGALTGSGVYPMAQVNNHLGKTTGVANFFTESSMAAPWARGRVYDTWSTHYSHAGNFGGMTTAGTAFNGWDDDTSGTDYGMVDDPEEMEVPPPYSAPLRAIQVKIRAFDPGSRQVREMTVEQDFLPE